MSFAHIGKKSHLGVKHTPESIAKIVAAKLGKKASPETRQKMSIAKRGRPCTLETRAKISDANRGENGPNWKGGISFEPYCPKFNEDLRARIRAFFEYRCLACGKSTEDNQRKLGCHHVEYNKEACCDGKPIQFAALCARCHGRTNHEQYRWEIMLHRIIDEIYGGRSYFTQEEFREMRKCRETH